MTMKEAHDAFGDWDAETQALRQAGVLNPDQAVILVSVAGGKVPFETIDRLMPGGDYEIKPEQAFRLMQIFGDRLKPIQDIIGRRMAAREQKERK